MNYIRQVETNARHFICRSGFKSTLIIFGVIVLGKKICAMRKRYVDSFLFAIFYLITLHCLLCGRVLNECECIHASVDDCCMTQICSNCHKSNANVFITITITIIIIIIIISCAPG